MRVVFYILSARCRTEKVDLLWSHNLCRLCCQFVPLDWLFEDLVHDQHHILEGRNAEVPYQLCLLLAVLLTKLHGLHCRPFRQCAHQVEREGGLTLEQAAALLAADRIAVPLHDGRSYVGRLDLLQPLHLPGPELLLRHQGPHR
ncbi:hypothetical protein FOCC_FOCC014179 [Frankliniella occidentalis]|nr:hypothetical protein FOCC_FOCC014179 [Frankliniella occidentalis]